MKIKLNLYRNSKCGLQLVWVNQRETETELIRLFITFLLICFRFFLSKSHRQSMYRYNKINETVTREMVHIDSFPSTVNSSWPEHLNTNKNHLWFKCLDIVHMNKPNLTSISIFSLSLLVCLSSFFVFFFSFLYFCPSLFDFRGLPKGNGLQVRCLRIPTDI